MSLLEIIFTNKSMLLPWKSLLFQCLWNFYGIFRKNTHFKTRQIYKTLARYVDDIITYIKSDFIRDVINSLNKFLGKIKITYEVEHSDKVSFFSILLMRSNGKDDLFS